MQNKTTAGDLGRNRVLIHSKTAFGRRMDAQPRRQRDGGCYGDMAQLGAVRKLRERVFVYF